MFGKYDADGDQEPPGDRRTMSLDGGPTPGLRQEIAFSLVIPAYDEDQSVAALVEETLETLRGQKDAEPFEIILVDDGSTDKTGRIIDTIAASDNRVRAFHHPENRGLGAAVKTGFSHATGRYVSFIPGDGQMAPSNVLSLFRQLRNADLIISERQATVPMHRRALTSIWRVLMKLFFRFETTGTQGIYIIRRDALNSLGLRSTTGLLNLEVIMKSRAAGHTIEHGVTVTRRRIHGRSKVANLSTMTRTLWEIIVLRFER